MELFSYKIKNFLYFWKWNFLALYFSYISGSNFSGSKNEKKYTLKMFVIFQNCTLKKHILKNAPSKNTFQKFFSNNCSFKNYIFKIVLPKIINLITLINSSSDSSE